MKPEQPNIETSFEKEKSMTYLVFFLAIDLTGEREECFSLKAISDEEAIKKARETTDRLIEIRRIEDNDVEKYTVDRKYTTIFKHDYLK